MEEYKDALVLARTLDDFSGRRCVPFQVIFDGGENPSASNYDHGYPKRALSETKQLNGFLRIISRNSLPVDDNSLYDN